MSMRRPPSASRAACPTRSVREQGQLVKVESWGRRKLAYPVGKQRKGVYVYVKYVGGGGLVAEVERNLKLQDAVVKYMTVQTADVVDLAALQVDPEETKLGKIELAARRRERRVAREAARPRRLRPGADAPSCARPKRATSSRTRRRRVWAEEPPSVKAEAGGEEEK